MLFMLCLGRVHGSSILLFKQVRSTTWVLSSTLTTAQSSWCTTRHFVKTCRGYHTQTTTTHKKTSWHHPCRRMSRIRYTDHRAYRVFHREACSTCSFPYRFTPPFASTSPSRSVFILEGNSCRYYGNKYTWDHFSDMSDSRLLAEQLIWAGTTEGARNEAFNCTNGDVFTMKEMWKVLCRVFELEFDECSGFDVVGVMSDGMGGVWDEIVEKYGLVKTKLEDVHCFDALAVVGNFESQHVCSMNKSREFGFMGFYDTMKTVSYWVGRMREMKIIP
ncbi:(S)-8-oxocitronellyl enol synthase [Linum perenne]